MLQTLTLLIPLCLIGPLSDEKVVVKNPVQAPAVKIVRGNSFFDSQPGSVYIEVFEEGAANWTDGVLTASGIGLLPPEEKNRAKAYLQARGYARLEALANLLALIDRIQIDAQYTGKDYIAQNEEVRASINGFIRGAQVLEERKITLEGEPAVLVVVGTAMYGRRGLSGSLLKPGPPSPPAPALPRIELSRPDEPGEANLQVEGDYTGLIVDARGLNVRPSMLPRILRADGSVLYGKANVDPEVVIEKGMAAYVKNLESALQNSRAGKKPLIVRAIGVYRQAVSSSDVVLSKKDADKLVVEDQRSGFLQKLNVVLVID